MPEFDHLLEQELELALASLDRETPLLALMARYHLGFTDITGNPTDTNIRRSVQGKRVRPFLAFQCCAAVGGDPAAAAPLAAAIELLHNFTLIHDDIQDRSPNRRHRSTVWRVWGDAQAINAGDALFALAQRTLLRTRVSTIEPADLLRLVDEFCKVTITIVRGQVLDLSFENESTVEPAAYLDMIGAKTAAIVRFAAWSGALVGGADPATAARFGELGEAIGIGFQVKDDVLGIWGDSSVTGKDRADDIRRRKKSLPLMMLLERATEDEAEELGAIFGRASVSEDDVATVLDALNRHDVYTLAMERVAHYHELATTTLSNLALEQDGPAFDALEMLIERLDSRDS